MSNVSPLPTRPSTTSLRGVRGGRWRSVISAGCGAAGGGDRQERAHPAALEEAAVVDGGGDGGVLGRDRARALGELLRAEVVGRRVLQVAGAVRRPSRRRRRAAPGGGRRRSASSDVEPAGPVGRGGGAVAVEPVVAEQRALDEAAAGELALERDGVDDEGDGSGPGGRRRAGGRAPPRGGRRRPRATRRGPRPRRGGRARPPAAWTTVTWPRAPRISPASISPWSVPPRAASTSAAAPSSTGRLRDRHHQHVGTGAEGRGVLWW